MGLSIVLFIAGVLLVTFQLRQLIFPTHDHSPERAAEIRGLRVFLIIVGVGLIGLSFNVYPVDEPFGGAPYPRSSLIPAQTITREAN